MPGLRYEFPKCRLYLCIIYDILNLFNEDNLKEYLFHLTKQAKIRNNDTYRTVEEILTVAQSLRVMINHMKAMLINVKNMIT